jgi:hypothetical protein
MAEFSPITTVTDFKHLDDGEVLEGYFDGFHGGSAPGSDRSRSFWHGWRNGRVDAGLFEPDLAQRLLAQDFRLLITGACPWSPQADGANLAIPGRDHQA